MKQKLQQLKKQNQIKTQTFKQMIQGRKEQNDEFQQIISKQDELKQEITELKQKLAKTEAQEIKSSQFIKDILRLSSKIGQLQIEIEKMQDLNKQLTNQLSEQRREKSQLEIAVQTLKIQHLKQIIQLKQQHYLEASKFKQFSQNIQNEKQHTLQDKDPQIQSLKSQIAQVNRQYKKQKISIESETNAIREKVQQINDRIEGRWLQDIKESLDNTLCSTGAETQVSYALDSRKVESYQLLEAISLMSLKVSKIIEKLISQETELTDLRFKLNNSEQQIATLKEKTPWQEQMSILQSKVQRLTQKNEKLEQLASTLSQSSNYFKEENQRQKKQVESLKIKNKEQSEELESTKKVLIHFYNQVQKTLQAEKQKRQMKLKKAVERRAINSIQVKEH